MACKCMSRHNNSSELCSILISMHITQHALLYIVMYCNYDLRSCTNEGSYNEMRMECDVVDPVEL